MAFKQDLKEARRAYRMKKAKAKRATEGTNLVDLYADIFDDLEEALRYGYKAINMLNKAAKAVPQNRSTAAKLQTALRTIANVQGEVQTAQHDYDPVRTMR